MPPEGGKLAYSKHVQDVIRIKFKGASRGFYYTTFDGPEFNNFCGWDIFMKILVGLSS